MNIRGAGGFTPAILTILSSVAISAQPLPSSTGNEVTFKAETNLVLVPVVVRDAKGNVIGDLRQEDFQLFDNGKAQLITSFTVEETAGNLAEDRSLPDVNTVPPNAGAEAGAQAKAAPMAIPDHFVALLFDDLHMKIGNPDPPPGYVGDVSDLWYVRDAALKFLATLKPADRVAVFTTSGQPMLDFTTDLAKVRDALSKLRPGKPVLQTVPNSMSAALEIEDQTRDTVVWCQEIVRRMSRLPGQRTVVLLSPGLLLRSDSSPAWSELPETMQLIDNAIRSRVVINSVDARGLALNRAGDFQEFQARVTDGTGGTFIRDTNDLNGAVNRLAATPKYIYVLGFAPQALKPDGHFHRLTVKLQDGHKLELQARAGYWAPDAKEMARRRNQPASANEVSTPHLSEAETREVAQALGIANAAGNTPPPEVAQSLSITAAAGNIPSPPEAAVAPSTGSQVTFKAETNMVLVPVVVRDDRGNAVGDLRKDDFQLFDDGRIQAITSFELEETSGRAAPDRSAGDGPKAAPMILPEHFAALIFDDAHLDRFDDIVYTRNAALKYMDKLQPADRLGIFTASGQFNVDFTTDREKVRAALMKLTSGPPTFFFGMSAEQVARSVISQFDSVIRRMSILPGQRTVVFISPNLPIRGVGWDCLPETMRLIDHAIRSRVVIGSLDSRGLALEGPIERSGGLFPIWEFQLRVTDGTGGRFWRDANDLDAAVEQLAATPKFIYILGFSPQTAKQSGFHKLRVKLENEHQLDVQARAGYWDVGAQPVAEKSEQPAAAAKVETLRVDAPETKELTQALDIRARAPLSPAPPKNDEIVTKDQPVTFKVQSNLVEVPVVVRDPAGHALGNLRQGDFRIFDKGKPQEITKFAVEKAPQPSLQAESPGTSGTTGTSGSRQAVASAPTAPAHFVAFVFDDVHARIEDLPQVRAAIVKYVQRSLGPQDRVALFTTSGRNAVDFTDRPEALSDALLKISPSPIRAQDQGSCGAMVSYFQAVQVDQQMGLQPQQTDMSKCLALRVAVEEIGDFHTALQIIRDAYTSGLQESRAVLATLRIAVQRMAAAPGQRNVVLVSPGFFVPADLQDESSALITLAIRSRVLIGSVDARGVWTHAVLQACQKGAAEATLRDEIAMRDLESQADTDEMIALADGTGGTVNLNNDFLGGVQKAAAAPEYLYILGFTPQNLKLDGSFHQLKVTASSGEKVTLQVRRGYWAPKHAEDEVAVSRQQIEDAVFSREEIHGLPVDMHTRVNGAGGEAKLSVLTSVDLKSIPLRKVEDRNRNDLTIVSALFDTNGNFIAGTEKIMQLRLRDETVQRLEQKPPVVITTDFDVKPGGYLVRLVVRDDEGQQLTTENAAVRVAPAQAQ